MTDLEFQRQVTRGLKQIMHALINRYGLSWSDFMPREETIIQPLGGYLSFDCAEHGNTKVEKVFGNQIELACGCTYSRSGLVWERIARRLAPTERT